MARYIPPRQGKIGQVIDVLVLLVLTLGALYVPLLLGLAGGAKEPLPYDPAATWESLGQDTPAKVERWQALGQYNVVNADPTDKDFQALVTARYDYWSFSVFELILMVVVVVGYFAIVIRFSDKEYREVIAEKFGERR
jgi:hypothetical protein